jgi:hypothetical protein
MMAYPPFDEAAFELADAQRKACGMSELKRVEYLLRDMDEWHQTLIDHDYRKSSKRALRWFLIYCVVMAIYVAWELW